MDATQQMLIQHSPPVVAVDRHQADIAAVIHASTRKAGVSYADATCLALAVDQGLPVYTADRKWQDLELEFEVDLKMIR